MTSALWSHVRAFVASGALLYAGWSWGSLLLGGRRLDLSRDERIPLCVLLGMGATSATVLGLGLLGLLTTPALLAALALPSLWNLRRSLRPAPRGPTSERSEASSPWPLSILAAVGALGVISLILALAPPTRYDALMYHLVGPQAFLEHARVAPSPDRWWLNFPANGEMLYTVAMALGPDTTPGLVHVSFLVLYLLSTYALGERLFGAASGRLAVILLLGMPILIIWASGAEVDFAWAAFELQSGICLMSFLEGRRGPWLALSGVFAGLAMGTKYLAVLGFIGVVGNLAFELFPRNPRATVRALAAISLFAGALAAPWFIKNLAAFGDPAFPFLGGGERLDPARMEDFRWYATSLHGSRGVVDWLMLPLSLILHPGRFSATHPLQSAPNPLLLLFPLIPWLRPSRPVSRLAAFGGWRYLLWSFTPTLSVRYLLPAFPWMAVVTASWLATPTPFGRVPRGLWTALRALPYVVLGYSLLVVAGLSMAARPFSVVFGLESRQTYLARSLPTFRAMDAALVVAATGDRVLTTGDGRAYYFPSLALDNDDQFLWLRLVERSGSAEAFATAVAQVGADYLLVSEIDLEFFLEADPTGRIDDAVRRLMLSFLPICGEELYRDDNARLFRIECRASAAAGTADRVGSEDLQTFPTEGHACLDRRRVALDSDEACRL